MKIKCKSPKKEIDIFKKKFNKKIPKGCAFYFFKLITILFIFNIFKKISILFSFINALFLFLEIQNFFSPKNSIFILFKHFFVRNTFINIIQTLLIFN